MALVTFFSLDRTKEVVSFKQRNETPNLLAKFLFSDFILSNRLKLSDDSNFEQKMDDEEFVCYCVRKYSLKKLAFGREVLYCLNFLPCDIPLKNIGFVPLDGSESVIINGPYFTIR